LNADHIISATKTIPINFEDEQLEDENFWMLKPAELLYKNL
jgi:hypothetical protein